MHKIHSFFFFYPLLPLSSFSKRISNIQIPEAQVQRQYVRKMITKHFGSMIRFARNDWQLVTVLCASLVDLWPPGELWGLPHTKPLGSTGVLAQSLHHR